MSRALLLIGLFVVGCIGFSVYQNHKEEAEISRDMTEQNAKYHSLLERSKELSAQTEDRQAMKYKDNFGEKALHRLQMYEAERNAGMKCAYSKAVCDAFDNNVKALHDSAYAFLSVPAR